MERMFVVNAPVRSCCGEPAEWCRCGHPTANRLDDEDEDDDDDDDDDLEDEDELEEGADDDEDDELLDSADDDDADDDDAADDEDDTDPTHPTANEEYAVNDLLTPPTLADLLAIENAASVTANRRGGRRHPAQPPSGPEGRPVTNRLPDPDMLGVPVMNWRTGGIEYR